MKKAVLFAMMTAVLCFTACSKEEPAHTETNRDGMILYATVDQPGDTKATFTDNEGVWHFDFEKGDIIRVTNSEIGYKNYYTFTYDGEKFISADAKPTTQPARWHACFPSNDVSLVGQSGKWEDIADLYAMDGYTPSGSEVTGEDGLSITLSPRAAILKIINQKGSIDINVLMGKEWWVAGFESAVLPLPFNHHVFESYGKETKQTLLSTTEEGTCYIAVPANRQISIKDGDEVVKSTGESGLQAGKYYELTIAAIPTFTVTFDMNGKTGTAPESLKNIPYGSTITEPSNPPTAEGYTFAGWYKDKTCNNLWNFSSDKVTSDVTLYAAWTDGLISGKFTVNASGKQVYFTRGNLWADSANKLYFEDSQYNFILNYDKNHVSHFSWAESVSEAITIRIITPGEDLTGYGEYLFCDENHKVSVNGSDKKYYALSKDEWKYLFKMDDWDENARKMKGCDFTHTCNITYCGKKGLVIYPDDYSGYELHPILEYTEETFPKGCVFLPAAGWRKGENVVHAGDYEGFYRTSSAKMEFKPWNESTPSDEISRLEIYKPYNLQFGPDYLYISEPGDPSDPLSIRLVVTVE